MYRVLDRHLPRLAAVAAAAAVVVQQLECSASAEVNFASERTIAFGPSGLTPVVPAGPLHSKGGRSAPGSSMGQIRI